MKDTCDCECDYCGGSCQQLEGHHDEKEHKPLFDKRQLKKYGMSYIYPEEDVKESIKTVMQKLSIRSGWEMLTAHGDNTLAKYRLKGAKEMEGIWKEIIKEEMEEEFGKELLE